MLFHAKLALRSVCDITPELLGKLGVRGLLLDIDNTLTLTTTPRRHPVWRVGWLECRRRGSPCALCPTTTRRESSRLPGGWGWISSVRGKNR